MKFNDIRLQNRLGRILEDFTNHPAGSIPMASESTAAVKAAYRFLSNDTVEHAKIIEGLRCATIDRMNQSEDKRFLFCSDATNLVFTGRKIGGIGVLRNQKAKGLNLHTTIVINEQEVVLGAVQQTCWGRNPEDYGSRAERHEKPIEEKESYRWIESLQITQEALPDDAQGIFIGDRGSDIYDLFLVPRKSNTHMLIRAAHNRSLDNQEGKLFNVVQAIPSTGTMQVKVCRTDTRKERIAHLEIRYKTVTLNPPRYRKELPSIQLNAVVATEIVDDPNTQDQINWRILTTLPINSLQEAQYIVSTYAKRWIIERFHYTLKEGCKVEELQLEEAERISKAVAIYTIVACRLMYITYFARVEPDKSCEVILEEDEWKALYCYAKKTPRPPRQPPTIAEAVFMIATLGGFLGRKSDADPGVKVIWRGIRVLESATEMYRILNGKRCG